MTVVTERSHVRLLSLSLTHICRVMCVAQTWVPAVYSENKQEFNYSCWLRKQLCVCVLLTSQTRDGKSGRSAFVFIPISAHTHTHIHRSCTLLYTHNTLHKHSHIKRTAHCTLMTYCILCSILLHCVACTIHLSSWCGFSVPISNCSSSWIVHIQMYLV